MLAVSAAILLATSSPGDQPPADVFAAICTGKETIIAEKRMESHTWTERVVIDLPNKRFCLAGCTTWKPIAAVGSGSARLIDSKAGKAGTEDAIFSWRDGRLHYLWSNPQIIGGQLHSTDRQGNCTLEPSRK